jgi:excisionase family DNA binding protein
MTVKDAAQAMNVSVDLVYDLVNRKHLGHTRIGFGRGRISISADDIADYLRRRHCAPEETKPAAPRAPVSRKPLRFITGVPGMPAL